MKRRIFFLLAAASLALLTVSCGKADPNPAYATYDDGEPVEAEKSAEDTASDEAGLLKIGFSQVGHESDWRQAATEAVRETFSKENGYELTLLDADNDADAQKQQVSDLIDFGVDYLIIDPIIETGWEPVLTKAQGAGIPVLVVDRTISDSDKYLAWFGSDFVMEGRKAGAWLKAYLAAKNVGSDGFHIGVITGTEAAAATLGRSQGFDEYVYAASDAQHWIVDTEACGDFTEEGGKAVMESFLEKYPDLDVIVCQNDNMAYGAMAAMDEAGVSYGKDGDKVLISFDAMRDGLTAVKEGKISCDIECNPLSASLVAEAIQTLEAGGGTVEKENFLEEGIFAADDTVADINVGVVAYPVQTVTDQFLDSREY